jgi:superfamily II DNA or RNA helicase
MESYENGPYTVRLLKKHEKTGSYFFPSGLVYEAIEIISELGYEVDYVPGQREPKKLSSELNWKGPALWQHQQEALAEAHLCFVDGQGVILHIPTRGGKTLISLKLMSELRVSTLIIVHNEELLRQWKEEIREKLGVNAGEIRESTRDIRDITIGMIQTLNNAIKKGEKFNFDFLIIDECHHYSSQMFYYVAMRINSYYRLGLSATPRREDGDDKKFIAAIGKIVHPVSVSDLITRGILVKPKFIFYKCKVTEKTGYKTWSEAYKKGIVDNVDRNDMIADITGKYHDKQVYIHVTRISHGKQLQKLISGSVFISGEDTTATREKELQNFKTGKTKRLVSTLMGEGVNIPIMDVIINAASGRSWTSYVQRLGRVLTASENKSEALVIDFLDYGHKWLRDHAQRRMEIIKEMFPEEELRVI